MPDLLKVPTCGWLLSVLRAPRGHGVYPYHSLSASSATLTPPLTPPDTLHHTQPSSHHRSSSGGGGGGAEDESPPMHSTSTATDLTHTYSIEHTCRPLRIHGFDQHLGDLLYLIHYGNVPVNDVLEVMTLPNLASRIRAKIQLEMMLRRYEEYVSVI